MPNCLIRHGWVDSERIDRLTGDEERFFLRLMLNADDAGRFDGRPEILRARLFPLKFDLRSKDVEAWRDRCATEGLLIPYPWDGKPYLQILRFQRRGRGETSKYPGPDGSFEIAYVARSTPEGKKEFVTSSLPDGIWTPSASHQGGSQTLLSETETKTGSDTEPPPRAKAREGVRGSGWSDVFLANEERRTLPQALDSKTFRSWWVKWIEHLIQKAGNVPGRRPSLPTLDQHIAILEPMGEARAIEAIKNSIELGWGKPELPKPPGAAGGSVRGAQPMA
jgi:hypothetical protein